MPDALLRAQGLGKRYGEATVLDDVSLRIRAGSVHALVGANGAGKSTLIKLITGLEVPTAGSVLLGDEAYTAITPRLAREHGVHLVPQERHVCPDLTVAENILLGRVPTRSGMLRRGEMGRRAREALDEIGLTDVDPRMRVRDLSVAQMQLVEIARAFSARARLLIMDEPTAALGPTDIARLFAAVRRLQARGVGFLYVSHHLEEVFDLADEVTVLRDGRLVATRPIEGLDLDELIRLLLGQAFVRLVPDRAGASIGAVALSVRGINRGLELSDVSFDVHHGEIVAVTGGTGSGRAQVLRAVIGALPVESGSVSRPGIGPVRSPSEAARRRIAFLPEDRKHEGILGERNLVDNVDLGWLAAVPRTIDLPSRRRRAAGEQIRSLSVVATGSKQQISRLSGGNQQKVLLGRCFGVDPEILVFEGPTAGVDLGSRQEIHRALRDFAGAGGAVIVATSDLEEAREIADRAIVMRRGRIAGQLTGTDIDEEQLMALEHGTTSVGAVVA